MSASESSPRGRRKLADSDDDSASSSSSEELLFKYPNRGAFKRKAEKLDSDSSSDESEEGKDSEVGVDDSESEDDESDGISSSPPWSRRGAAASATDREKIDMTNLLNSDGDSDGARSMPSPKRQKKPRSAEDLEAQAKARVEALLESEGGDSSTPVARSTNKKDLAYAKRMQKKLADATNFDVGPATTRGTATRFSGGAAAAAAAAAAISSRAVSAETAARHLREQNQKGVKLMVERSKRQRHLVNTKLGTMVYAVEEACRGALDLVSPGEEEAEVALYYKDKKLDSDKTLRESGIPQGKVTLRLDVMGGSGDGGGGGEASGPPITLKVRVDGGKTFQVTTTTGTKFSAFMDGFNASVGIPPARASECVFKFDGDNLKPDGTPEGDDMEQEDIIDAKFPADLMNGIQAAPSELSLVAPKTMKTPRKTGNARSSARTTTAAALAAAARPLGGSGSRAPRGRVPRNARDAGVGGPGESAARESEIVVLD